MRTARYVFAVMLLCTATWCNARPNQHDLDSVFRALDKAITHAEEYVNLKNDSIKLKKAMLESAKNAADRYQYALELYREYRSFNNDSALSYLAECRKAATELNDNERLKMTLLRIGHQYVVSGYYSEAPRYFDQVKPDMLPKSQHATYYHYLSHLYRELEMYAIDAEAREFYHEKWHEYSDSVAQCSPNQTALFLQRRCITLVADGKTDEAKAVNDQWMEKVESGTMGYSLMAYNRAEIFGKLNQPEQQKYWLAVAAQSEVATCDRNPNALWKLAEIEAADGDIDRAMRYIDFSWYNVSEFSTRKRAWLMAPVMSDIHNIYQQKITSANTLFFWLSGIIGLLAAFLLLAFFYARKERRVAVDARAELQEKNASLSTLNSQLFDSNRVKDEYIREFLQMCSTYIDKMDDYRVRINRKLKANQVKDLLKITGSEQMKKDERNELMAHFDAVFLHLFPTFVNDFNELLVPEARVYPQEPGSLNTLLRIFALVRLGIDESSKIADFLDYSANSIYNYRSRIKKQSLHPRADFEEYVKQIGLNQH